MRTVCTGMGRVARAQRSPATHPPPSMTSVRLAVMFIGSWYPAVSLSVSTTSCCSASMPAPASCFPASAASAAMKAAPVLTGCTAAPDRSGAAGIAPLATPRQVKLVPSLRNWIVPPAGRGGGASGSIVIASLRQEQCGGGPPHTGVCRSQLRREAKPSTNMPHTCMPQACS